MPSLHLGTGRRTRARLAARLPLSRFDALCWIRLTFVLAPIALSGCGVSEGLGALVADPAKYSLSSCRELVGIWKTLGDREKELRDLISRARDGAGGTVIGELSYRTDYETVLREKTMVTRVAAERKCALTPVYQSDQTIR